MYIKVKVLPKSKKEEIVKKNKDSFVISVKEPAERNLANKRVCQIIAGYFNINEGKVRIVNGHHSSGKILSIMI